MYESLGLIGIQLPEKYKENFDVSSEGTSTCAVSVCIHRTMYTNTNSTNQRAFARNVEVLLVFFR